MRDTVGGAIVLAALIIVLVPMFFGADGRYTLVQQGGLFYVFDTRTGTFTKGCNLEAYRCAEMPKMEGTSH